MPEFAGPLTQNAPDAPAVDLVTVPDFTARDNPLNVASLRVGAIVRVVDTGRYYQLLTLAPTWLDIGTSLGGGGGGGGEDVPDPVGQDGKALFSDGAAYVLRFITPADVKSFAIAGFNLVGATVVEVGATVASPSFTAAYSGAVTIATLGDNDGNPDKDVISTPTAFASDFSFVKTINNATVLFTLSAEDASANSDNANVTLRWRPLVFTGVTSKASGYTGADVEALAVQALRSSAALSTIQLSPTLAYILHVYPESYGPKVPADFTIGNLGPGDMSEVETGLSITNAQGFAQNHRVARSDNLLNAPGGIDFGVA